MTLDEFLATLDRNNWYFPDVEMSFRDDYERGELIIERKGRDLPDIVEMCKSKRLYPVVDKKLGVILGCQTHGVPRQELFRYHYYAKGSDLPYVPPSESIDRYISEGHGWFISKMRPRIIVAGITYTPDRFDRDVFMVHEIDHQDMPRDEVFAIIRGEKRLR